MCLRTREAVCWRLLGKGREEVRQAEQLGLGAVYSKEQGTLEELEAQHGQVVKWNSKQRTGEIAQHRKAPLQCKADNLRCLQNSGKDGREDMS